MSPRLPPLTKSSALAKTGSTRRWNITPNARPARRAAASMRSAAETVSAIGFSQITCLPAFRAAMHGSTWTGSGPQLSNTSISGSAANSLQSVQYRSNP